MLERRRQTRVSVRLKVEYRTLGSFISDWMDNISEGGLFLLSSNPLPIGTQVRLVFSLPGIPLLFDLLGKVRWATAAYREHSGMGIEFTHISDSVRNRIQHYLAGILDGSIPRPGLEPPRVDHSEDVTQPRVILPLEENPQGKRRR